MGWSSLLSDMNSTCVDSFGLWAIHLESGHEFKLIMTSTSGIAQFVETNKTTAFVIETDMPDTLVRGGHIMIVSDNEIYELAEFSPDKPGGITLTLENPIYNFDYLSNEYDFISERSLKEKLKRLSLLS